MGFKSGLDLSRMFYEEEIEPALRKAFPQSPYAAATLGMGSEVLGLDDEVSRDHEWGPRVTIFLAEEDHARYAEDMRAVLQQSLPTAFHGIDMMWRKPGVDLHDTRETALYHVTVGTVASALGFCGGSTALPLQDPDWLRISEQHLLQFTAGAVYRDDVGELTRARELLAYYPDNVLRFLLMGEWRALNGDWFPIGRIGSRGDELGLRLHAARIVHHLMHIAFMVSRTYYPYKKWFGTMFQRLPLAGTLGPLLREIIEERDWRKLEEKVAEAAVILLRHQNRLGITPAIEMAAEAADDGRHHMKIGIAEIVGQLSAALLPPLKALAENELFFMDGRSLILWNMEVGRWPLLLQKQEK